MAMVVVVAVVGNGARGSGAPRGIPWSDKDLCVWKLFGEGPQKNFVLHRRSGQDDVLDRSVLVLELADDPEQPLVVPRDLLVLHRQLLELGARRHIFGAQLLVFGHVLLDHGI